MCNIDKRLSYLGHENQYKVYSSIFRVFICLLILKQVMNVWLYIPFLFGGNSFIFPTDQSRFGVFTPIMTSFRSNIYLYLGVYVGLLILYCFGIGKQLTAFIVFIFFDVLQKICPEIINGGDNLLKFILLYLVFVDSYNYFSLKPLKYKSSETAYFINFLSNVFGFCICFHIVLIYLVSALEKLHTDVWFHGIATYYTLSLDRFSGTSFNSRLAQNPLFVTFTTYFSVLTELFYPTLVWFNKTKKIIIICMIGLHLMIYLFMMIYDFQLIFIMTQGFFFSNLQWKKLLKKYMPQVILNKQIYYAAR